MGAAIFELRKKCFLKDKEIELIKAECCLDATQQPHHERQGMVSQIMRDRAW